MCMYFYLIVCRCMKFRKMGRLMGSKQRIVFQRQQDRMIGLNSYILSFSILFLYVISITAHGTLKQCPNPLNGDDDVNTDDDYGTVVDDLLRAAQANHQYLTIDGPTDSCGTEHAVGGSHEHCIHIHMNIHDICIVIGGWNVTMDGREALPIVRALVQDVVREQESDLQIADGSKQHKKHHKDKDDNSTSTDDDDGNNDDVTIHVHLNIHDIHIYIPVLTPTSSMTLLPTSMEDSNILDDQTKRIQFADEVGRFVNAVRLKSFAQRLAEVDKRDKA